MRSTPPPEKDSGVDHGEDDDDDDEDDEEDEDEGSRVKTVPKNPKVKPRPKTPKVAPVKRAPAKPKAAPAKRAPAKPKAAPVEPEPAKAKQPRDPVRATPSPNKPALKTSKKKQGAPKVSNRTPRWFKKGELASVGAVGLIPWERRVGGRIDMQRLGPLFYLTITPTVNYSTELAGRDLTMSFGFPLRLQMLDTRGSTSDERFGDAGRFRKEDWNTAQDFAKIIRFLTYGRKEDHFYFNLNAFRTATTGHGVIMKRYNPNLSIDIQRVSLELDAFSDFIGVQTYLNNVAGPNLAAALLFIKPLSLVNRSNYIMRSFSIGASVAVDWNAPIANKLDIFDADRDGRRGELLLGGDDIQPQFHAGTVLGYGVDLETKFYKSADKTVDLKAYVDVSFLTGQVLKPCSQWPDGPDKARCSQLFENDPVSVLEQPEKLTTQWVTSDGLSLGVLGRFTLGERRNHALRVRLEFRNYAPNYLPSYFDTFYQVERVQYRNSRDPLASNPANQTKLRRILERTGEGRISGVYFEASYALWKVFEASVGLSFNTRTADNGFFLHLGVPRNKYFSFYLTYYKSTSHAEDLHRLLENSLFILQARGFVLPFLHVYVGALTPFGFSENNQYEQIFDVNAGLELSFEY